MTKIQILYPLNLLNTASMFHADSMFTIFCVQAKSYTHYAGTFMTYPTTNFHMIPRIVTVVTPKAK